MSGNRASFNLVDEPWIRVRYSDGGHAELSLMEVFAQAERIEALENELPAMDFAILRVMLAIVQRAVLRGLSGDEDPTDVWGGLWRAGSLPVDAIGEYLAAWRHRFDLFDEQAPFMQVAGLTACNSTTGEVKKLLADVPDGLVLFSLCSGDALQSLGYAEAARWLVHVHAFDTSGIKTGVIGDAAAKGGKSYPIGTGWAGRLGGIAVLGADLGKTLLLNTVLGTDGFEYLPPEDDLPAWEQGPKTPGDDARIPAGSADAFTWQSRRALLVEAYGRVNGIVLSNGDKLEPYNAQEWEPMSAWRRSENLEKRLGKAPVYYPVTHQAGRALWRGLQSVLPERVGTVSGGGNYIAPDVLNWVGELSSSNGGEQLERDYPLRIWGVGYEYGVQSSVITTGINDSLSVHAFLLSAEGSAAAELAKSLMAATEEAVRELGFMAQRLDMAAGGSPDDAKGAKARLESEAYFELDSPFRSWLAALDSTAVLAEAHDRWNETASTLLRRLALRAVSEAGSAALVGRKVKAGNKETWVSAAGVEGRFLYRLSEILPYTKAKTQDEEGSAHDEQH